MFPVKFPHDTLSKNSTHSLLSLFFSLVHITLKHYIMCSLILEECFLEETLLKERQICKYIQMAKANVYIETGYNGDLEPLAENYDNQKFTILE